MPERLQRQFDVHAVRIGSHTRFHVLIKCSKCGHEKVLDYAKNIPDEVIAKKLKQWGWLLGRNRANDLCPSCIGVSAENKLANRFKVKIGNEEVPAPRDLVVELEKERREKQKKVDAAVERVFGGKLSQKTETNPVRKSNDSEELVQAIATIESDVRALRADMMGALGQIMAALELVLEQLTNISANGRQQIEAISRIAPVMARGTEALASGMATATRSIERLSTLLEQQPVFQTRQDAPPQEPEPPGVDEDQFTGVLPVVSVTTHHTKTKPERCKTEFRIARSVWLRSGFQLGGTYKCERSGDWFIITQAEDGERGSRIQKVNSRSITIRFELGNVNLKDVHVMSSIGRLMIGPAPAKDAKRQGKSLIELAPMH